MASPPTPSCMAWVRNPSPLWLVPKMEREVPPPPPPPFFFFSYSSFGFSSSTLPLHVLHGASDSSCPLLCFILSAVSSLPVVACRERNTLHVYILMWVYVCAEWDVTHLTPLCVCVYTSFSVCSSMCHLIENCWSNKPPPDHKLTN